MVAPTIVPALVAVVLMYFAFIRFIPWRRFSYAMYVALGVALISAGRAKYEYAGLEVALLGAFITWLDPMGYLRGKRE